MEKLPETLVFEILSRLDDSADVARCRLAWKTFDTVSTDLRSINLLWPLQRYVESRTRASNSSTSSQLTSPFKTIFLNLVSNLRVLESVRIGAENFPLDVSIREVAENADDLYLTDGDFVKEWLPRVSGGLKSLSITDFLLQSCWRQSNVLSLVSAYCQNLVELELKNSWLSVDKLNPMPMLTSLTLEFIRLDDNVLSQFNQCFPNLEVLNLIYVRGLKTLMVCHLNLKTCHLTVNNSPSYLYLVTPNLITLRLECIRAKAVYIEAPMLSHLYLSLVHLDILGVKNKNLETLWLKDSNIWSLENLTMEMRDSDRVGTTGNSKLILKSLLFDSFTSLSSVCFNSRDPKKGLKTFCGYLLRVDPSLTFSLVGCVLDQCVDLVDVSLLFHRDVGAHVSRGFISRCMACWPKLNWRFGMWEEGTEDSWINI